MVLAYMPEEIDGKRMALGLGIKTESAGMRVRRMGLVRLTESAS
jgi:hypothetical protein